MPTTITPESPTLAEIVATTNPLDGVVSPREYLDKARELDPSMRPGLLERFFFLCGKLPKAEQEAFLREGKALFGYRMATAYGEAIKYQEDPDRVPVRAPFLAEEGFLAEMVWDPKGPEPLGYLVSRSPSDTPEFMTTIERGNHVLSPPASPLYGRAILLPSGVQEYGSPDTLFRSIRHFIKRYVYIDQSEYLTLASVYVMVTWTYDRFRTLPYFRALGDWGSGKSRLLETLGRLCYRTIIGSGAASPSSLFRVITLYRGTLQLDEMDFIQSSEIGEMTKILNTGYSTDVPVWRVERGADNQFEVQFYDTFSPKLLATRGPFEDKALESRCLTYQVPLVRDLAQKGIPSSLGPAFEAEAQALRNQLLFYRFRMWAQTRVDEHAWLDGVEPRVNQIIQPLLACAPEWLHGQLIDLARSLSAQVVVERQSAIEGLVVDALLSRWKALNNPERVLEGALVDYLKSEYHLDKLTSQRVTRSLRGVGLTVDRKGGKNWAYLSEPQARRLCDRFDFRREDYGLPPLPVEPSVNGHPGESTS